MSRALGYCMVCLCVGGRKGGGGGLGLLLKKIHAPPPFPLKMNRNGKKIIVKLIFF